MDQLIQTEAIVLNSFDFKEYDKIIKLFTPTHGVLSATVKMTKKMRISSSALVTPFTQAEYLLYPGRSDLYRFHQASLLNQHLHLRSKLAILESASCMVKAITQTQLPQKPTPELYKLLLALFAYLSHENKEEEAKKVTALFYIKLLKHEGILQIEPECYYCQKGLKEKIFRFQGALFCEEHAPPPSLFFNLFEEESLVRLNYLRDLRALSALLIDNSLYDKIQRLYEQYCWTEKFKP